MTDKEIKKETEQNEVSTEGIRLYELGYHIISSIPEDKLDAEVAKVRAVIEDNGGKVTSEEWPKNIALAYPIQKDIDRERFTFTNAYFGWMRFDAGQVGVVEMRDILRASDVVLRFILIKTKPEIVIKPKPFLKTGKGVGPKSEVEEETLTNEDIDKEIDKLVVEE